MLSASLNKTFLSLSVSGTHGFECEGGPASDHRVEKHGAVLLAFSVRETRSLIPDNKQLRSTHQLPQSLTVELPSLRYLSGPLPYVRRHITVTQVIVKAG